MGSEAIIFFLLAVIAVLGIEFRRTAKLYREYREAYTNDTDRLEDRGNVFEKRCAELEAEIQRLRKIPLTQKPDKTENAVIKAKSPAQVRQITEEAWGRMPKDGLEN